MNLGTFFINSGTFFINFGNMSFQMTYNEYVSDQPKGKIMSKKIPAYIENELRLLDNALTSVMKHAVRIEEYVDRNTDGLGQDYFCEARLDVACEFDIEEALELLREYLDE